MNDQTIRDLYFGRIRTEVSHGCKTKDYTEHMDEFSRLYETVKAALPEEKRALLADMINEENTAQSEEVTDAFVMGFKIGVKLTAEGLLGGNDCRLSI